MESPVSCAYLQCDCVTESTTTVSQLHFRQHGLLVMWSFGSRCYRPLIATHVVAYCCMQYSVRRFQQQYKSLIICWIRFIHTVCGSYRLGMQTTRAPSLCLRSHWTRRLQVGREDNKV